MSTVTTANPNTNTTASDTMTHHDHGTALTCNEMKATLSAYLDDELTRDERLRADAHLVGCGGCRGLVERAETLDASLRARFAEDFADSDSLAAAASVDVRGMESRVLAQIGADHRRTWIPRLAVAAAIAAVAGGTWLLWTRADATKSLAPSRIGDLAAANSTNSRTERFRSDEVAAPENPRMLLASLDAEDRQALYATSLILHAAQTTDFTDLARRTELRETARYDELVERLAAVLPKLPAEERAVVALARDATARIAEADADPEAWTRLQEDVSATSLDESVDQLSDL
jgi:hypothetical protein